MLQYYSTILKTFGPKKPSPFNNYVLIHIYTQFDLLGSGTICKMSTRCDVVLFFFSVLRRISVPAGTFGDRGSEGLLTGDSGLGAMAGLGGSLGFSGLGGCWLPLLLVLVARADLAVGSWSLLSPVLFVVLSMLALATIIDIVPSKVFRILAAVS